MGRSLQRRERTQELKRSADVSEAKDRLLRVESELYHSGLKYDADRLRTIIGKLEAWQNSY
jgi:hypothetical protein